MGNTEWAAGAKVHLCGLGHIEGHISEEAKAEIHQYAYHLRDHRDQKADGCRFCADSSDDPLRLGGVGKDNDPDRIVAEDFCECGVFFPDVTDGISFHRPGCKRLRRKVVVVLGSMRYHRAMQEYALASMAKRDDLLMLIPEKWELEHAGSPMPGVIHRRKIQIADSVLVFNAYGYIGEDTAAEIGAARLSGKPIDYYEPVGGSDCDL